MLPYIVFAWTVYLQEKEKNKQEKQTVDSHYSGS